MASGLVRVALLAHFVALGRAATHSPPASSSLQAEPGAQLQGFDDDRADPPLGLSFLRVISGDCRRCLKECLGAKIQAAQVTAAKIQAPVGLMTWYLFRNRPFRMWPLEEALAQLAAVPPGIFGGLAAGAYMSCRSHCEMDCPYPGVRSPARNEPPQLRELDGVDPTDARFLAQLYQRGRRSSKGSGSFASALSDMFRIV